MWFRTIGIQLLGAVAFAASATAQTTPAPPAITRTVVAATKLPTVTDVPLHFRAATKNSLPRKPEMKSCNTNGEVQAGLPAEGYGLQRDSAIGASDQHV